MVGIKMCKNYAVYTVNKYVFGQHALKIKHPASYYDYNIMNDSVLINNNFKKSY